MIQMSIPLGDEFKESVKNFCSSNNIEWGWVWSECGIGVLLERGSKLGWLRII
jgi:hypothetical protein